MTWRGCTFFSRGIFYEFLLPEAFFDVVPLNIVIFFPVAGMCGKLLKYLISFGKKLKGNIGSWVAFSNNPANVVLWQGKILRDGFEHWEGMSPGGPSE
jgi:hypothetical protein